MVIPCQNKVEEARSIWSLILNIYIGYTCKSLHELMKHRKNKHIVPLCRDFLKQNCRFSKEDCYHSHDNEAPTSPAAKAPMQTNKSQLGFWDRPQNMVPPSQGSPSLQGPSQAEWVQMKTMLNQLNTMMTKYQ